MELLEVVPFPFQWPGVQQLQLVQSALHVQPLSAEAQAALGLQLCEAAFDGDVAAVERLVAQKPRPARD